jgi:hypothetical protein
MEKIILLWKKNPVIAGEEWVNRFAMETIRVFLQPSLIYEAWLWSWYKLNQFPYAPNQDQ